MEGEDENSRFKGNLTADGVASLKARIEEKLKDFMGDYTDDALVDYVIVLLRNGRRKAEAAQELQVFLGDDNTSFVSWLWDHLSSNLHLYVQPPPPPPPPKSRGTAKRARRDWNAAPAEESEKEEDVAVDTTTTTTSTSASVVGQKEQSDSSKRQKIVWEDRKRDDRVVEREKERPRLFPLRSVVTSVLNPAEKGGDRKSSGGSRNERRRGREDDSQSIKRDPPARIAVNAPRRLLQFAVRDAVKPKQHAPSPTAESAPTLSRLRSFISAPASESLQGRDEEDNNGKEMEHEGKYSSSPSPRPVVPVSGGTSRAERSSVFDRLGRSRGTTETSRAEIEDKYSSDDSASDKDRYDRMEYSVAQEREAEVVSKVVPAVQASQIESKPSKILNISVNVNTWKPPGMVQETHSFSLQDNKVSQAEKTEDPVPAVVQKILPKTPIPVATRSLEDPDSRTLFVSNVHFGATKDALSRHFNKFGAVLKVIILADVNTGQPTGSAYVEFLQKESAEAALSLNGTSFMSRILKVVKKTSQESGPAAVTGWGATRGAHISSFPSHPSIRPPYMARGRAPVRGAGGRSLQWKRGGGQSSDTTSVPSSTADNTRSFTYTRVAPKADGQLGQS